MLIGGNVFIFVQRVAHFLQKFSFQNLQSFENCIEYGSDFCKISNHDFLKFSTVVDFKKKPYRF